MESKISDAQKEVWEWKEHLYEDLKNIPEGKRIEYLQNKVKNTIEKFLSNKKVFLHATPTLIKPEVGLTGRVAEPSEKYGKK